MIGRLMDHCQNLQKALRKVDKYCRKTTEKLRRSSEHISFFHHFLLKRNFYIKSFLYIRQYYDVFMTYPIHEKTKDEISTSSNWNNFWDCVESI